MKSKREKERKKKKEVKGWLEVFFVLEVSRGHAI
jgi:hypothetical protein